MISITGDGNTSEFVLVEDLRCETFITDGSIVGTAGKTTITEDTFSGFLIKSKTGSADFTLSSTLTKQTTGVTFTYFSINDDDDRWGFSLVDWLVVVLLSGVGSSISCGGDDSADAEGFRSEDGKHGLDFFGRVFGGLAFNAGVQLTQRVKFGFVGLEVRNLLAAVDENDVLAD